MLSTPASLRSDLWTLCSGIAGRLRSESLVDFTGIRTELQSSVQNCRVLCRTAEFCAELQTSVQNCRLLRRTADFCAELQSSVQNCRVLCRTAEFCAELQTS